MIKSDYWVIVGIIFMVLAHNITIYLINVHQTAAANIGEAKSLALSFEANPITKFIFSLGAVKYIWGNVILPVLIFGIYYYYRNKYKEIDINLVNSIAFVFVGVTFLDFMNDFSVLLTFIGK